MQVEQVVADSELSPSQHAHFHPLVADELSAVLDAPVKEKPEDVAPPKENPLDEVGSASGVAAGDVDWPKTKPPLDGAEVLAAVPLWPNANPPLAGAAPKEKLPLDDAEPEANPAGLLASGVADSALSGVAAVVFSVPVVLAPAGRGTMHTPQAVADSGLSPSQHAHFHPLVADELLGALANEKPPTEAPPKENPADELGSGMAAVAPAVSLWPKAKPPLDGAEVLAAVPLWPNANPPLAGAAPKENPPLDAEPKPKPAGLVMVDSGFAASLSDGTGDDTTGALSLSAVLP
jgi:hypothetical protein